ncbi:MAG TPA: nitrogen fixation protein NifH [Anaerolineaceae bacterium]|nr:nitrogen fixation protein NifH [Anaerolineaceae bacterium]
MAFWDESVSPEVQQWLLESPFLSVRFLTLRDLVGCPPDDPALLAAQRAAHKGGKIHEILSHLLPGNYWVEPGPGYLGKYRSSVWSLIALAQLGASAKMDERLSRACAYHLDVSLTRNGQFTINGTPSSTLDCLQGNMCAAFLDLGYADERLTKAFEWMARSVTGEGVAPMEERGAELRYYAGKIGPDFQCGANNKLPCAWGAVKVLLAFSKLPTEKRPPLIQTAIRRTVDFLFSVDPATADYPCGYSAKPSRNWRKFGFPVFYITDLLQLAEGLVTMGYGNDPRLANTIQLIREKQDAHGRCKLEYDYTGKTWTSFGEKDQPNPWVTIRALRVLKGSTKVGND